MIHFYLNETARACCIEPLRQPRPGDAGYDIRTYEDVSLQPGEQSMICTGLHVEIPFGMVGVIKDRSSMARAGLRVSGGVIDASYRGEIRVLMENRGASPFAIRRNDRIAQMLIVPCCTDAVQQVSCLDGLVATDRGADGFGSTGR
jgi:dUTP pyrophosphatase